VMVEGYKLKNEVQKIIDLLEQMTVKYDIKPSNSTIVSASICFVQNGKANDAVLLMESIESNWTGQICANFLLEIPNRTPDMEKTIEMWQNKEIKLSEDDKTFFTKILHSLKQ